MKNLSAFAFAFASAALISFSSCDTQSTTDNDRTADTAATATSEADSREEREERNKKNMRELIKAVEDGDSTKLMSIMAEDAIEHTPMSHDQKEVKGSREIIAGLMSMQAAFPDMKNDIHHMVADGDMVMAYMTTTGTHKKDFMGMKASNKSFKADGVDIVKFNKEGKAVEHWGVYDNMTMMTQLGMLPDHSQAPAGDKRK